MLYRLALPFLLLFSLPSWASTEHLGAIDSPLGWLAIVIFVTAYVLVIAEEYIRMRKSKPVLLGAGMVWILVACLAKDVPHGTEILETALDHNLMEYAALLLFLLTAMVYVNAMTERNVFEALRAWLVSRGFSYRQLFWITGVLAFFISPVADNLTTALLMGTVVLAVGSDKPNFVALAFINIVVAANAGGAFSPFGDITTLMVWQSGHLEFFEFFALFLPSLVNYLVPAIILNFAIPHACPVPKQDDASIKTGGLVICALFICTIATAVTFEQVLHLPPFLGMMTGLGYLFFYSYYLKLKDRSDIAGQTEFNIFDNVSRAEWDTLLFFFGVIFCVGGLATIGYLAVISEWIYTDLGPTKANILAGLFSAVVDNIPVMFAILTMEPEMAHYQWLLVTLTAGVGGSLLSVGSAAGVALMGHSKGLYTFFSHLKWSWAIALGYGASIYVHYLING